MDSRKKRNVRNRRKYRSVKRKVGFIMIAVVFTIICCMQFGNFLIDAHGNQAEEPVAFKYYKSIEIEDGDTLWGIAKQHMTDHYDSIYDYIDEIKEINQLTSDDIQSAQFLTIAYYDEEYK